MRLLPRFRASYARPAAPAPRHDRPRSTQVASNITDVNKGTGETGSASTQMLASAQSLSKESGQLRLEVDKFLTAMRAAQVSTSQV